MLPPDLTAALNAELRGVAVRDVTAAVEGLSRRYRAKGTRADRGVRDKRDVLAYLAYRLPATYAAVAAALAAVREARPDWQPSALLDAGTGPGTAAWAATEIWPSLRRLVLLDRSPAMLAAGNRLAQHGLREALRDAEWHQCDLFDGEPLPHCDLVVAAYTLNELREGSRPEVVQRLWDAVTGTLVLIEPGTPDGFRMLQGSRLALVERGARTLAPCPHDRPCPLLGGERWCHFSARVERSRLHRQAKRAELGYEDERFAYVALTRAATRPVQARVVSHPHLGHGRIELELCSDDGVRRVVVGRHETELYHRVRRLRWGDAVDRDAPDDRQLGPG